MSSRAGRCSCPELRTPPVFSLILAFTTGNDVSDNSRALKQVDYVPYFRMVDQRLVLDTSFLASRGYL